MFDKLCSLTHFFSKQPTYQESEPYIKRDCIVTQTHVITAIALVIISLCGITGLISQANLGWSILGLSLGSAGALYFCGNLKNRIPELIITSLATAVFVTLGILSLANCLTSKQLGWAISGTATMSYALILLTSYPRQNRVLMSYSFEQYGEL